MKTLKSILLSCLTCMSLLCACSHDAPVDAVIDAPVTDTGEEGNTFITIDFHLPEAATRASGTQTGTEKENKVSSINVILLEAQLKDGIYIYGPVAGVAKDITPTALTTTHYNFTAEIPLPKGTYRIFLIANPDNSTTEMQSIKVGTTYAELRNLKHTAATYEGMKNVLYGNSADNFLMTNAHDPARKDIVDCRPGRRVSVSMKLQRAAARIDYLCTQSGNKYVTQTTAQDATDAQVEVRLTSAALTNVSKSCYYFKQLSADGNAANATIDAEETTDNYVIDVDWSEKQQNTPSLTNNFFYPVSTLRNDMEKNAAWQTLPGERDRMSNLFYASENTVPTNRQLQRQCLAVLLRGEFDCPALAGETTILTYENKIYKAAADGVYTELSRVIAEKYELSGSISITNNTSDDLLEVYDIKRFRRNNATDPFVTYYAVWLRYNDNKDANVSGTMEFSIVRNTLYRFKVNSISGLGTPVEPNNPVEPPVYEIKIQMEVLDWDNRSVDFEM